jgi:hypothetical protein
MIAADTCGGFRYGCSSYGNPIIPIGRGLPPLKFQQVPGIADYRVRHINQRLISNRTIAIGTIVRGGLTNSDTSVVHCDPLPVG